MKILLPVVCVLSLTATTMVFAASNKAPDVIELKMGAKIMYFKHKQHVDKLNNECYHCHKSEIGKIDGWDEERAHVICIACHDLYDKGPTDCKGCHTK